MKKLIAILMSTAIVLSLFAGCSGDKAASSEAPAASTAAESAAPAESTAPVESAAPAESAAPSAEPVPSTEPEPEPEAPVELYVSAAASLTDVMTEIGNLYTESFPNVTLTFTFDSSGTLQTQIEEGAPSDLFVSAAQKQMNALSEQGLIAEDSRVDLLVNKVVLIIPEGSEIELASFEDVTTDKVSMIAIGDETVPVGQYTQEIYTFLGTWEDVQAKANLGTNVRAVLAWVESGDVDCGIVYATDAASTDMVEIVCEAPEGSHQPVIYPAAVLSESKYPDQAQAFLDFLTTDEAVALFEQAGFTMAE